MMRIANTAGLRGSRWSKTPSGVFIACRARIQQASAVGVRQFENLLQEANNELARQAKDEDGVAVGYTCYYMPEVLLNLVKAFSVRLKAPRTGSMDIATYYMERNGVELYNAAKVCAFDTGKVEIEQNASKGVPNPWNTWQPLLPENIPNPLERKMGAETKKKSLSCDLVVLAMGGRADDALYLEALRNTVSPEIYNIGDSFSAGRVLEANRAAYRLATLI